MKTSIAVTLITFNYGHAVHEIPPQQFLFAGSHVILKVDKDKRGFPELTTTLSEIYALSSIHPTELGSTSRKDKAI